jgi:hypothetical protein
MTQKELKPKFKKLIISAIKRAWGQAYATYFKIRSPRSTLLQNKKYQGRIFPRKLTRLGLMVFALQLEESSMVSLSGI